MRLFGRARANEDDLFGYLSFSSQPVLDLIAGREMARFGPKICVRGDQLPQFHGSDNALSKPQRIKWPGACERRGHWR